MKAKVPPEALDIACMVAGSQVSHPSDRSMMLATGFLALRSSRTRTPFSSPARMLVEPSEIRLATARAASLRPSSDILCRGNIL
ncbi:hypothetical protein RJ639_038999 [Escallonia herrerae]|uniref:Uncharacterized protein n=1 Tax=Escallonia herrerae TaxID=1293975 RepID=A0AA89B6D9_9ASTE|nr:hypothetical protein RJ639_038999 [Escallonia herrerae]